MSVLVDTSIWSLSLRRKRGALNKDETRLEREWRELVKARRALLMGPIRQELLSGIRHEEQFERVRQYLSNLDDVPVDRGDYEQAARFFNLLRSLGIIGTNTDLILSAVAYRLNVEIFTTDPDFKHYALHLPIRLFRASST